MSDLEDFQRVLFGFLQAVFFGETAPDVEPDFEDALERLSQHKTLKASSAVLWPAASREALKSLISNWLMVLEISADDPKHVSHLPFILGSSSTQLNERTVSEILYRSDDLRELHRRIQQARSDP